MAKCTQCFKSGWFFKVNSSGICKDCEHKNEIQAEIEKLNNEKSEVEKWVTSTKLDLDLLKKTYDEQFQELKEKAKKSAISEIAEQISELELKHIQVQSQYISESEKLKQLEDEIAKSSELIKANALKIPKSLSILKSLKYAIKKTEEDFLLNGRIHGESEIEEADELLKTTIELKLHCYDLKDLKKLFQQNKKCIQDILEKYETRYTQKSNKAIYRLMVIALEAELQNVLYNLNYDKLEKSVEYIKEITSKYYQIATDGNKSIEPTVKRFIGEIEYFFIESIKIEHEYYVKRERAREEQRAIREQMRQEAAERKLLEEKRKKVELEEAKYHREIELIQKQIEAEKSSEQIILLEERKERIQTQLGGVEQKKEEIIKLQNGKAGYIYIISNLGSFGDTVFKIGMTRRDVPQERIDELGDASVPFRFDVHSLIFSNSASELESNLHKTLHNKRVNKVNRKKEFFKTTIDELESLVFSLEPTAEFKKTMAAEQYFQSLEIDEIPTDECLIEEDEETT